MADGGQGWRVEAYTTPKGKSLMRTFIAGLGDRERTDATAVIKLVEERGNLLREPHSKLVEPGIFEPRRYQVRIFYVFRPGRRIVLLDGMVKKQDKIPEQVLLRIRAIVKDLIAREERGKERQGS